MHGITPLLLPSSNRDRGTQTLVREMNEYSRLLEENVRNGKVCLIDGNGKPEVCISESILCNLSLPRNWALFMQRVCDSFSKVSPFMCI